MENIVFIYILSIPLLFLVFAVISFVLYLAVIRPYLWLLCGLYLLKKLCQGRKPVAEL
jgi:hypothetical protein